MIELNCVLRYIAQNDMVKRDYSTGDEKKRKEKERKEKERHFKRVCVKSYIRYR